MHVWRMNDGRWQLDLLTSQRNNMLLRGAIVGVTGNWFLQDSYATRAEAEAVKARIMAHV